MIDLEAIAKDAAQRVHKNGGCVPQLAFAPILFALQDALSTTPARAEAQDEGAAGEPVFRPGMRVLLTDGSGGGTVCNIRVGIALDLKDGTPDLGWAPKNFLDCDPADLIALGDAHPSPTPAADADRVRIALEKAKSALFNSRAFMEIRIVKTREAIDEALAALKSTAAKEEGE